MDLSDHDTLPPALQVAPDLALLSNKSHKGTKRKENHKNTKQRQTVKSSKKMPRIALNPADANRMNTSAFCFFRPKSVVDGRYDKNI